MSKTLSNEKTTASEAPVSDDKATRTARYRDLLPEEIAALDIDQVARDNSAALEDLMRNT
jgi:hypothetical protein